MFRLVLVITLFVTVSSAPEKNYKTCDEMNRQNIKNLEDMMVVNGGKWKIWRSNMADYDKCTIYDYKHKPGTHKTYYESATVNIKDDVTTNYTIEDDPDFLGWQVSVVGSNDPASDFRVLFADPDYPILCAYTCSKSQYIGSMRCICVDRRGAEEIEKRLKKYVLPFDPSTTFAKTWTMYNCDDLLNTNLSSGHKS